MYMSKLDNKRINDKRIRNILRYDTSKAYFGSFTANDLSDAVGRIKASRNWTNPIDAVNIYIGHIDGDVICNALWHEMSYNPVRFGTVSPFMFHGKNSLYHFCNSSNNHALTPENMKIFSDIQYELKGFMQRNAHPNGSWNDTIIGEYLTIRLKNGHTNREYKMLAHLRDCIRIITTQNINDFTDETMPYRAGIISTLHNSEQNGKHGHSTVKLINSNHPVASVSKINDDESKYSVALEYDYDVRIDNLIESLKIIIENKTYYDRRTYEQALRDYEYWIAQQGTDHQY